MNMTSNTSNDALAICGTFASSHCTGRVCLWLRITRYRTVRGHRVDCHTHLTPVLVWDFFLSRALGSAFSRNVRVRVRSSTCIDTFRQMYPSRAERSSPFSCWCLFLMYSTKYNTSTCTSSTVQYSIVVSIPLFCQCLETNKQTKKDDIISLSFNTLVVEATEERYAVLVLILVLVVRACSIVQPQEVVWCFRPVPQSSLGLAWPSQTAK